MWNTVDVNLIERGATDVVKFDWPVAMKLAIALGSGLVGACGVLFDSRIRALLMSGPGLLLTLLASILLITSVYALEEVSVVSRGAALIVAGYMLFVPTALLVLGVPRIVLLVLAGIIINLLVNWWLFLFVPGIGVFHEAMAQNSWVQRMGGLGHPNSIGRISVLASILSLATLRGTPEPSRAARLVLYTLIAFAMATLLVTYSRSAAIGFMAATAFLLYDRIFSRAGLSWLLVSAMLLFVALFAFEFLSGGGRLGSMLLSATTKTGKVEELATATGRTEIWTEALRLIAERPLIGWGLNSSPVLLENYSQQTHNMVLNATFSGGVFAGLAVIGLLVWNFVFGLTDASPLVRGISMFVLVSGLFENTVLDTFSSPSTFLWILVLLIPAGRVMSRHAVSVRTRASMPVPAISG